MNRNFKQLDVFVLLGIGLAIWELYIAYKNESDTLKQTELIKKGFNIGKEDL